MCHNLSLPLLVGQLHVQGQGGFQGGSSGQQSCCLQRTLNLELPSGEELPEGAAPTKRMRINPLSFQSPFVLQQSFSYPN